MICHREPEYNTHALARIHKKEHNAHAMFSKIELTFSMDQFILHALKTHITQTPNKWASAHFWSAYNTRFDFYLQSMTFNVFSCTFDVCRKLGEYLKANMDHNPSPNAIVSSILNHYWTTFQRISYFVRHTMNIIIRMHFFLSRCDASPCSLCTDLYGCYLQPTHYLPP